MLIIRHEKPIWLAICFLIHLSQVSSTAPFCYIDVFVFMIFPNLAPINGELFTLSLITLPVTLFYLLSSNILIGLMKVRIFNIVEF